MKRRDFLRLSASAAAMWPLVGFGGERQEHAKLDGITLYDTQQQFVDCKSPFKAMVGGRGAGTSFAGACNTLYHAKAGGVYLVTDATWSLLRDGTIRTYRDVGKLVGCYKRYCSMDRQMFIATGDGGEARIDFRSADNLLAIKGQVYAGWNGCHASAHGNDVFAVMIEKLCKNSGWLALTFTPASSRHWTSDVCKHWETLPGCPVFHAGTFDNPYLPDEFARMIGDRYRKESVSLYRKEILGRFA